MKKKTKPMFIIAAIAVIILLFPICLRLKDGGSKVYRSIIGIYEVKDWKQMGYTEKAGDTLKTGITIKVFGMKVFDNTKTEAEGYAEEPDNNITSVASAPLGAIGITNFPITMSAEEMLQKAKEEGFVVVENFEITNGEDVWQEFFATTNAGTPATISVAHYYTINKETMSEELYEKEKDEYPKIFFLSLSYNGKQYTITDRPGYEEEPEMVRTYPYLVKFEGKPSSVTAIFDRYEYYVLVHDKDVTWQQIEWGGFSSQMGDAVDHCRVVSKHITEENHSGR